MAGDPSHKAIVLAGAGGCRIDTRPQLGTKGVREMGHIIHKQGLTDTLRVVYVANHYRAIADIFAAALQRPRDLRGLKRKFPNQEINAWLDTKDQVTCLKEEYLEPLIEYEGAVERSVIRGWLDHISWD